MKKNMVKEAEQEEQIEFSTIFFDTLFGLVLFFGIDSLLDIKDSLQMFFYLFSSIIIIHWWMIFRAADDCFQEEVTSSFTDLIIGILEIVCLDYIILLAKVGDYFNSIKFLFFLIAIDLFWGLIWKYVGQWRTKNKANIITMERELTNIIRNNLFLFSTLFITLFCYKYLSDIQFVAAVFALYATYVYVSFRTKILDIKLF